MGPGAGSRSVPRDATAGGCGDLCRSAVTHCARTDLLRRARLAAASSALDGERGGSPGQRTGGRSALDAASASTPVGRSGPPSGSLGRAASGLWAPTRGSFRWVCAMASCYGLSGPGNRRGAAGSVPRAATLAAARATTLGRQCPAAGVAGIRTENGVGNPSVGRADPPRRDRPGTGGRGRVFRTTRDAGSRRNSRWYPVRPGRKAGFEPPAVQRVRAARRCQPRRDARRRFWRCIGWTGGTDWRRRSRPGRLALAGAGLPGGISSRSAAGWAGDCRGGRVGSGTAENLDFCAAGGGSRSRAEPRCSRRSPGGGAFPRAGGSAAAGRAGTASRRCPDHGGVPRRSGQTPDSGAAGHPGGPRLRFRQRAAPAPNNRSLWLVD